MSKERDLPAAGPRIYLIYDREHYSKNKFFAEAFITEGAAIGLSVRLLISDGIIYGIRSDKPYIEYEGAKLDAPAAFINRTMDFQLSVHLEHTGYKVFNNSRVSLVANNKILSYIEAAKCGVKILDTEFLSGTAKSEADGNFVTKPAGGRGGEGVVLDSQAEIKTDNPAVRQAFLKDAAGDVRVYIVGNKIIAAVLRRPQGSDFRANISQGGKAELYELSASQRAEVEKITNGSGLVFGLAGVDFLLTKDGQFVFNEIEDVVGCRSLYELTDINIVKIYLEYIKRGIC